VNRKTLTPAQLVRLQALEGNLMYRGITLFKTADANKDGCVDLTEYKANHELEKGSAPSKFPVAIANRYRTQYYASFRKADTFRNQALDEEEFTSWVRSIKSVPPYVAAAMFEFLDLDASGSLSVTEFSQAFEKWNADPARASQLTTKHHQMFQQQKDVAEFSMMDLNGDGKISKSEAFKYATGSMPQSDITPKELLKLFAAADTNKDQFLTFKEFTDAGGQFQGDGPATLVNVPSPDCSNQTFQNVSAVRSTKSSHMKDKQKITLQMLVEQLRPFIHGLNRSVPALLTHIGKDGKWNATD